jgi:hypothetical protein
MTAVRFVPGYLNPPPGWRSSAARRPWRVALPIITALSLGLWALIWIVAMTMCTALS